MSTERCEDSGSTSVPTIEGAENEHDWEAVGRDLLYHELRIQGESVNAQLHDLSDKIKNGEELDRSELRSARESLDMALLILEKHLGPTGGGVIVTEFDNACSGEKE